MIQAPDSWEYAHLGASIATIVTVLVLYAQYRIDKMKENKEVTKEREAKLVAQTRLEGSITDLLEFQRKQQELNENLADQLLESQRQTGELKTQTALLKQAMENIVDRMNRDAA